MDGKRCRHVWVDKFALWCRSCTRTAMFVCSKCNEGRCYYHRQAKRSKRP